MVITSTFLPHVTVITLLQQWLCVGCPLLHYCNNDFVLVALYHTAATMTLWWSSFITLLQQWLCWLPFIPLFVLFAWLLCWRHRPWSGLRNIILICVLQGVHPIIFTLISFVGCSKLGARRLHPTTRSQSNNLHGANSSLRSLQSLS
jgi:hypothetical protein